MAYRKNGKCSRCGSKGRRWGEYARAWNALCNQAAGDAGYYCMNCKHIDFHTPDFELWFSRMPRWIVRNRGDQWREAAEPTPAPDAGESAAQQALFTPEAGSAEGKLPTPTPRR